ncbi:MAG: hypothetical protein F6K17_03210 [Okeania sp. SIO3C4]|nr:hypothetical protein [Okeania sp. SIO3B3]NER01703.1 hypothetical protein [Okeania sp. SIO3C4]
MKRIDPKATIRPTPEAKGYLDTLKSQAVFGRMVDAYVFAAAYAIKQNADISQVPLKGRQDIVYINTVDDEVRLALEAAVHAITKRNGQPQPTESREVLEIITKYAEVGLNLLKVRWEGKTGTQIQDDIRRIITGKT